MAVLVAGGWAAGYFVTTRLVFPAPPPPSGFVDVPDLTRLDQAEADALLDAVGLEVGAVDSLHHPAIPIGRVIGQSPLPGQVASPGARVWLSTSSGPQVRSVPDVVGITADAAQTLLAGNGFAVVQDTVVSNLQRGRVVRTDPVAGTEVELPDLVVMLVSVGTPPIPMPSVLGMTRSGAQALLDSLGLVVTDVREVFRFGLDPDRVVEQEPAPGTAVHRGDEARLAIGWRRRDSAGVERQPPPPTLTPNPAPSR